MVDLSKLPASPALMFSGGLDSTILAHQLVMQGIDFTAIVVNYGQRNILQNRRLANRFCRANRIRLEVIDVSGLASSYVGNMDEEYDEWAVMLCEVHEEPFSFIPIITLAAGLATSIGSGCLLLGYNRTDREGDDPRYKNSPAILKHIGDVFSLNRSTPFQILTPFWDLEKHEVLDLGVRSSAAVEQTWSCWDGQPFHCGKCPGCTDRKSAFSRLAAGDPTAYL